MKQAKHICFKSAVGFFSFFSSTNVETKDFTPIAGNGSGISDGRDLEVECFNLAQMLNRITND